LKDCDVIVEAIIEQLPAKRELFTNWMHFVQLSTIFAQQQSSLTITEIACGDPNRLTGRRLHFFKSGSVMKLVEVVRTIATDSAGVRRDGGFGAKLGRHAGSGERQHWIYRQPIASPYLLMPFVALEEGVGQSKTSTIR